MDTTTLSAIITLFGVIISVLVSFLSNKRLLKAEIEKLETTIEQNYTSKLLDKRLEFYPLVYKVLSDMGKKIKMSLEGVLSEEIKLRDIVEFQKLYNELNSKFGVVFSTSSAINSFNLRMFILDIIKQPDQTANFDLKIPAPLLEKLEKDISLLEFCLKQDLGVFIVDFQDPKRKLQLERFGDALKYREKKKTQIKK